MKYRVLISEQREFLVEASTEEEAKMKMRLGEYLEELDMICNDIEILEVVPYVDSEDEEDY